MKISGKTEGFEQNISLCFYEKKCKISGLSGSFFFQAEVPLYISMTIDPIKHCLALTKRI